MIVVIIVTTLYKALSKVTESKSQGSQAQDTYSPIQLSNLTYVYSLHILCILLFCEIG